MAHTTNTPSNFGPRDGSAVELAKSETSPVGHEPPAFAHDLVRTLRAAGSAVGGLVTLGSSSDVSVNALTAVVCAGSTPAAALQAAADFARQAPGLEPHSLALARVPGPCEGVWEWHITMTVSSRDPMTGEYGGSTHHADPGSS
ncbi:hypothetical protein QMK19_33935 [Streptomyces sp. H10-C2]|uniref:hypothetical protein n=1 Tax=unclassified Streptomyces TaxID=2593676 RepID=UPI0024B986C0|nr:MULTISPECIES: hypothetical protein [unclassified Streptomyces]MDJ0345549.1 hypothetical protein [Streptomyces sp. PH10-H1]MDJ0374495.1 hypothetical protein [Streptomyces sp. H10-C2]